MKRILTIVTLLLLASCSNDDVRLTATSKPGFENIKDVPIAQSAKMNLKKSMVMGDENSWIGQVVYEVPKDTAHVIDLYITNMPQFGWNKINDIRGEISTLIYQKDGRTATIQIIMKSRIFAPTEVYINMSKNHEVVKTEEIITEDTITNR